MHPRLFKHKHTIFLGILSLVLFGFLAQNAIARTKLDTARDELKDLQVEVQNLQEQQQEAASEARSLEEDLGYLEGQIDASEEELQGTLREIEGVTLELADTRVYIQELEAAIRSQKSLIEQYVNSLYTRDEPSVLKLLFSDMKFSELVGTIEKAETIQKNLADSIQLIQKKEAEIVSEKQHLFDKEEELLALKKLQEDQRSFLFAQQEEKQNLLEATQGEQEQYEELLAQKFEDRQNVLNTIRLLGGGDEGAVGIEEIYRLAEINSARLDGKVRPEFMVGLMKVESNLGQNVGRFFYKDALSGCASRPGNNTRINFAREEQAFEQIVGRLGLPVTQPVSGCPFPKYHGVGGAMGPAQFIPTTWLGYEPKIIELKGGGQANPWSLEDAMMAMALKLTNGGQNHIAGDVGAERLAAKCYLGGCRNGHDWYADKVFSATNDIKRILGK